MIIKSDFRESYDSYNRSEDKTITFNRMASDAGPNKREQFEILKQMRCWIPPIGLVEEVAEQWWAVEKQCIRWLVVYEDEMKHCGEGKVLFPTSRLKCQPSMDGSRERKIQEDWYGKFCSAWIGKNLSYGESLRYLQIGRHYFWLEYKSEDSWMSNVGNGSVELVDYEFNRCKYKYNLPVYAIDFVSSPTSEILYAVDFNISPGIGNVLQSVITHKEIYEEIERYLKLQ